MKYYTTNWALNDTLKIKKKRVNTIETEDLPKEIRHKLKLIEKAFR